MARIYKRVEGDINFQASTMKTLELSRNYYVTKYILELTAEVTNGAAPVYFNDNLFRLINNLTLVANGSVNIKQIPAEKLIYNSHYDVGRIIYSDITKTASGTFIQKQVAELYMVIPNQLRPEDTILNTSRFDTLNLNVNWADSNAIGTGVTVNSARLSVYSSQLIGYMRNKGEKTSYYKEVASKYNVIANNNNYLIKLDVNQMYNGFLITAMKDNLLTNNVIKNIRIKSGTVVFIDQPASVIQWENLSDAKIFSQSAITGMYYLDFTPRSRLSDMLNTVQAMGGFNTLELELDVQNTNANTFISVYPEFIEFTGQIDNP
jgi:hypothetical protein